MIAVFSGLLVLFLIVLFISFDLYQERRTETNIGEARVAAKKLGDNVNFLCRLPDGSKTTTRVYLPEIVVTDGKDLSGGNKRTIQLNIETSERNQTTYVTTDCKITGSLPPSSGEFSFQMERRKNDVLVNWTVIE